MFKKLLLAAGLVAAGSFLLFGTRAGAYCRAAFHWGKSKVVNLVPLEADIMAAKQMLADMDGKIENAIRVVATEKVAVKKMDEQYAARKVDLEKKREQLLAMRKTLDTNPVAGQSEIELQHRKASFVSLWTSYELLESQHESEGKLLLSRRQQLDAAERKVQNLIDARKNIKTQIAALEAKIKLLEAEKVASKVEIDDSEIADVKNLLSDIEKKLDVEFEVTREMENFKSTAPPASDISAQDVMQKMDEKFGKATKTGGTTL